MAKSAGTSGIQQKMPANDEQEMLVGGWNEYEMFRIFARSTGTVMSDSRSPAIYQNSLKEFKWFVVAERHRNKQKMNEG